MPTREDIDGFKQKINLWGDEPAIMEALGESIEDVLPPEPTVEESLNLNELEQDELSMDDFLSQVGLDTEDTEEPSADEDAVPLPLDDLDDVPAADSIPDIPDTKIPEEDFSLPEDLSDLGLGEFDDSAETEGGEDDFLSGLDDFLTGGEEPPVSEEPGGTDELTGLDDLGETSFPTLRNLGKRKSFPALRSLGKRKSFPTLRNLGKRKSFPALRNLGKTKSFPALRNLGTRKSFPALRNLGKRKSFPALRSLGKRTSFPALRSLGRGRASRP